MTQFVDTSALLALMAKDDNDHGRAVEHLAELASEATSLITHDYVLVETTALIQRRLGMDQVRLLHDQIVPALTVRLVPAPVRGAAVAALLAANQRRVSLVDWVSFEIMRREAIDTAFAFDEDFAQQGFTVVPK